MEHRSRLPGRNATAVPTDLDHRETAVEPGSSELPCLWGVSMSNCRKGLSSSAVLERTVGRRDGPTSVDGS
ncbi:hypothetical protein CV102_13950 [Natronococcus pandeyae]|uniref:Uncharacterized protein n=1 Tax=Natronococcus pandeyae TaxID=2055836 RepID=A0A8J8Q2P8_9EURY|nr:hypothetical protein CV102_13950 [Natronococcus pandeyae]